jgi:hypothetical protein
MQFIHAVYGLLLSFFPKNYREEYGEELQIVFHLSLSDAFKTGGWEPANVVLQELISLPKAILVQHLRERRKAQMVKNFGSYFNFAHGSWREFLSALWPFLIFGLFSPLITLLSNLGLLEPGSTLADGIGIAFLAVLAILFLAGIFSGLPRWFFPYIGFLLSIACMYGFSTYMDKWHALPFQTLYSDFWFVDQIVFQGFLWGGLTLISILFVALTALLPFMRRLKTDWTLLSFLLYGAVPFPLMITFDDYPYDGGLSSFFAFLIFVAGIWFYLRTDDPRRQFWVLFGTMTVSLLFAAGAKAIIYQYFWDGLRHFTWWTEMMSTIIMWMWLALTMLIPLVLNLLPRSENASHVT